MSDLLTPDLLEHIGRTSSPKTEVVTRRDIRKYAVATGQKQNRFLQGDVAPPLYYIALFWEIVAMDELSPDGVFVDKLIPELPLKRAMAGGVKVEYFRDMVPGDVVIATRTLTKLYEKQGSSGPLIFYDVVMQVSTAGGQAVLTETATRIMR